MIDTNESAIRDELHKKQHKVISILIKSNLNCGKEDSNFGAEDRFPLAHLATPKCTYYE